MNKEFVGILYTLGSDMPESEPMAFVQRMILQIRKHIPESGYLPTCSDRKPLKKYLGKSTDSESESDLQMILKVVALLMWSLDPSWYNRPLAVWCHNCASQPLKKASNNRRLCSFWWSKGSSCKFEKSFHQWRWSLRTWEQKNWYIICVYVWYLWYISR